MNRFMVTMEYMVEAADDCARRKRNKPSAVRFDSGKEENLMRLVEDVNNRSYTPSPSTVFIVTHPKPREVFAPAYEDRIIDHYISLRLMPILEWLLIPHTFSCMKGRGTSAARKYMAEAMSAYPDMCIAKWDVSGYFNSMDKAILWEKVSSIVKQYYVGDDKEDLLYLVHVTIFHDPSVGCMKRSPESLWSLIPENRTLFGDKTRGLAIGRLVAQMYGNIYLNDIDHWCNGRFLAYMRYVDDMAAIGDSDTIKKSMPTVRAMLADIGLTMHPRKFYMQRVKNGADIVGNVIKGGRVYIRGSTLANIRKAVRDMPYSEGNICRMNSLFGLVNGIDAYDIRLDMLRSVRKEWFANGYWTKGIGHFKKKQSKQQKT